MADIIRVLRVLEYIGPREEIEKHLSQTHKGTKIWGDVTMRSSIIGDTAEVLDQPKPAPPVEDDSADALAIAIGANWIAHCPRCNRHYYEKDINVPETCECPGCQADNQILSIEHPTWALQQPGTLVFEPFHRGKVD